MTDEIKLVYTGSSVEGIFLEEMLIDEGIGVIKRDTLGASVQAGWADGAPEDTIRLFVETINFEKARKILEDYFAARDQ